MRKLFRYMLIVLTLGIGIQVAAPAMAKGPITIGISDWPGWVAWYVAEQKGYFKKYGANVKLVWFPSYIDSVQALAADKLDANSQALIDTLAPIEKGVPLKVVLVTDNSAGNDAFMAKPGIQSLKQLKGKTVAFERYSIENYLAYTAFKRHGLNIDDSNIVSMTTGSAASALMAGRVAAAGVWNPWINRIQQHGKGHALFTSASAPGLIPDLLVAQQKSLKANPEQYKAIAKAWFAVVRFINAHPQEAAAIMAPHVDLKPKEYELSLKGTRFFGEKLNQKAMNKSDAPESLYTSTRDTASFLMKSGKLSKQPDPASFIDASVVNQAMAAQD
ncbi:ABC transporter substrate-binding protein [Salinisphaera sp. LB1]|uniref:ABC transporter substrate-binding protein n=1 Tax=Salinisphaera sp. LB1 TaxID=2183911 RepID=UPI000FEF9349|nr:ABC transporter substrate-binding protein [Salinisphaera sp. LB1]